MSGKMAYQERLPSVVTRRELDALNIPVVDEEGKEIVRPDVVQAVVQLASLAQLARIRKSLEKEEFEGKVDSKTLDATDRPWGVDLVSQPPYRAWSTASFFNDGDISTSPPGETTVYISINRPSYPVTLKYGESYSVDFTKADRRIEFIYYWCALGETASVRAVGKY